MQEAGKHPTYEELLEENTNLRIEIASLRQQLGIADDMSANAHLIADVEQTTHDVHPRSNVHKHSSPDEKIELFMRLFAGRTDVYAKRYVNKRNGQSGYVPVCDNEWVRGLCEKPKVKCTKCPNRSLLPLTKEVIYRHLAGKDQLGEDVVGV